MFSRHFFDWYNRDHHHAGIGLMTPDQVHYGQAEQVYDARQKILDRAFVANPERFVRMPPSPPKTNRWLDQPAVQNTRNPSLNSNPGCLKIVDTLRTLHFVQYYKRRTGF